MRRVVVSLLVAGFVSASVVAWVQRRGIAQEQGQAAPPEEDLLQKQRSDQTQMFMQKKLEHSQEVLRGITTEDYQLIAKHGKTLALLSLESNWNVLQTEEYVNQSLEFRRAADALARAGREENLGTATVAYLDLTVKCVNCHKYLRRHAEDEPN